MKIVLISFRIGWDDFLGMCKYGERARGMRRLLHATINPKAMKDWWPQQEKEAYKFLRKLLHSPEKLTAHVRHTAGATVAKLTYGYDVKDESDEYIDKAEKTLGTFAYASTPGRFLVDYFPLLKHIPWAPFQRAAAEWRAQLIDFAEAPMNFVRTQLAKGCAEPSFVSSWLEDASEEDKPLIPWAAGSIYAGGADTTVSAVSTFLIAMLHHPEVQKAAQDEIDRMVGSNRLPGFTDRDSLPYVEAIYKEVLRWQPLAPIGIPRKLALDYDDEYKGMRIPSKSHIIGNAWSMLWDSNAYQDPEKFNPSRFLGPRLESNPEEIIFGFGRRRCPGAPVAHSSVWLSIVLTLAVYDILPPKSKDGVALLPSLDYTVGVIRYAGESSNLGRNPGFSRDCEIASASHKSHEHWHHPSTCLAPQTVHCYSLLLHPVGTCTQKMTNSPSSSSGPPNIFEDGRPRDIHVTSHPDSEFNHTTAKYEATQLPPSHDYAPIANDGHIIDIPVEDSKSLRVDKAKEGRKTNVSGYLVLDKGNNHLQANSITDDVASNIPTLFRLLDLYQEQGSGGLVEKVLIDQLGLRDLLNTFLPGSYESISKIDFKSLDKHTIDIRACGTELIELPMWVTLLGKGSCYHRSERPAIFALGSIFHYRPRHPTPILLISCIGQKTLHGMTKLFLRFGVIGLRLCDQMVALISPEQVGAMVWTPHQQSTNDHGTQMDMFDESRMFSFEVEKSTEQEEGLYAVALVLKLIPDTRNMPNFKAAIQARLVPGEEKAGIMTTLLEPPKAVSQRRNETMFSKTLKSMIDKLQTIVLGDLTGDQLSILAEHGLRETYPVPFAQYEKRMALEEEGRKREYDTNVKDVKEGIQRDREQLKKLIGLLVHEHYSRLYPSLGISGLAAETESPDFERLREKYPELSNVSHSLKKRLKNGGIDDSELRDLKLAWHTIRAYLLQDPSPSATDQAKFVGDVLGGTIDSERSLVANGKGTKHSKFSWQAAKNTFFDLVGYEAKPPATLLSDVEFVQALGPLAAAFPAISSLTNRITACLRAYLDTLGDRLARESLERVINKEEKRLKDLIGTRRRHRFQDESQATGRTLLNDLRSLMPYDSSSRNMTFSNVDRKRSIFRSQNSAPSNFLNFHWTKNFKSSMLGAYTLSQVAYGVNYFAYRFIQLVRDKCLVVVAGQNQFDLYIGDNVHLPNIIEKRNPKSSFKYDRLGDPNQCIFAFDEGIRSLVLFHNANFKGPELSLFGFDETFTSVHARGSPFSLKEWYDTEVKIDRICFVSGAEEVCLIETSGRARILSLVTLNFRPPSIEIPGRIVEALSAPDGSCLLTLIEAEEDGTLGHKLLVFHWASFGATNGINPIVLPISSVGRVVTSFEGRNHIHLVSYSLDTMKITSVGLQIKQKATEFSFRSNQTVSTTSTTETVNNCLIDCHMDVWTRFPASPPVIRSTLSPLGRESRKLIFASTTHMEHVENYFSQMINKFERTTCKPIDAEIRSTSIVAISDPPSILVENTQCSRHLLGSFVVELICLIPLQDNRFIPLKDGVWDPEHERSLLGADVPAIINSLSIGWYESLFQSYMATKTAELLDQALCIRRTKRWYAHSHGAPTDVALVDSSFTGKSYCLNHFADTSFAGSAMRTTEGVWLSCTPTKDYLLVSLDFEGNLLPTGVFQLYIISHNIHLGVHSIERSAQEDALLVLFNTAISNLSFQSSAMVLDPESNPSLFNQSIVYPGNYYQGCYRLRLKGYRQRVLPEVPKDCSKGARAKFHIATSSRKSSNHPMASDQFLKLLHYVQSFAEVSRCSAYNSQKQRHFPPQYENPYGKNQKNLATHRAQQIDRGLCIALSRGSLDVTDTHTPLKNLDTDEDIPVSGPDVVFLVPDISGATIPSDEIKIEEALVALINFCDPNTTIGPRHIIGDKNYVESIQQQLFNLLDQRLEYVRSWVQVNFRRFQSGNQDIRNVANKFEGAALGMRVAIRLCMEACSSCHYLCSRPYRHSGEHQCGTTHLCLFSCEVLDDHPEPVGCGLAPNRCDIKAHSCGYNCHLIDKNGCAQSCVKPLYHEGKHLCSARLHSCGEPCSLQVLDSGYRCPGLCHIPWDEPHTRHLCNNSNSCPLECQLCRRLCHESDHFHALNPNAVHLCGQSHSCTNLCAARGICRIETQPSAVEEQFSGRHETFQYTRYTQVEQRLTCALPIPAGRLYHEGEHSHTVDANAFHYCNVRCPSCQYLCTLPLEHPQQLHETSHGSMTTTQWAIQGTNQDTRYELDGRSFGIGDEGAPMLCHLVCSAQGRHVHIDYCREPGNCIGGTEFEHIKERMYPDPERSKDWISHRLKWARSDPYSREQQSEFAKWYDFATEAKKLIMYTLLVNSGPEHNATATAAANPSYCDLPIFHQPQVGQAAPSNGYVSADGHRFNCTNPARLQQAYHVTGSLSVFLASSGSMRSGDRMPLSNTPVTTLLRGRCNNRYGAVLSALHSFWSSRETGLPTTQARQDAYSVVTFNDSPATRIANDFTSTTGQLLTHLLQISANGGTNFNSALKQAQKLIQTHWNSCSPRTPVLVFLSDGLSSLDRNVVYNLCRACVQLGKPLAFYSVSFGPENSSTPLREMVQIAREVYASAPRNTMDNIQGEPCAYYNLVDPTGGHIPRYFQFTPQAASLVDRPIYRTVKYPAFQNGSAYRTVSLRIGRPVIDAFSAPDGSCLLVVVFIRYEQEEYRVPTRFDGRGGVHVVPFDAMSKAITSTILQIAQKATEFSFRSDRNLIDCHLEVWARFPVVPAVARNTLTAIYRQPRQLIFSSPVELQGAEDYFARMVSSFETTTRKPVGSTLMGIQVKLTDTIGRNTAGQISEFKLGSFIVALLCLIPLQ
ncbi:cytochrome P450 [Rhizoctonia solani AG-1 IA]|uniref:Cytochrome P450 n=1 Tax=Thanatephorus cucumeris (strain AG1-IA) TaxID=983506 RepID=L8WT03_THACA|nr:cytochrome P450 [Rhizoctonia solani AG-1 IA]